MLPYLALFMIPAMFSLRYNQQMKWFAWYATFVIFVVFVGLRHEVGPDWLQYDSWLIMIGRDTFSALFAQPESLSKLLFWIAYQLDTGIHFVNFFAAIIMLIGVFSFALRTTNPWLAVLAATPYFILVVAMSGIRQAAAMGVILYLLSQWERYSMLKRAAYVVVASLFHTSAIISSILIVTQLQTRFSYKVFFSAFIGVITLLVGSEVALFSTNIDMYRQRYIESGFRVESLGAYYHIAFIAIPAILSMIFRKQLINLVQQKNLLVLGTAAMPILIALTFYSSTAASRLTIYLYFVPMMVFPALTLIYQGRLKKQITLAVVLYHFALLFVWFTFSNHRDAYIPYKNLLFVSLTSTLDEDY